MKVPTESSPARHPYASPSARQSHSSVRLDVPEDHSASMQVLDDAHGPFHIFPITARSHSAYSATHSVENHWHAALEVVYTAHGHSHHYIDGKEYRAEPGSVFVISPYSFHSVTPDVTAYSSLPEDETVAIVLHIGYPYMDYLIPDLASSYFTVCAASASLSEREAQTLLELFHLQTRSECDPYKHIYEGSLINDLLYTLCSAHLQPITSAISTTRHRHITRLKDIIEYTDGHFTEHLSQHAVAQQFHFSKEYFARFFKESTGLTYMAYVAKKRCALAVQLLDTTDASITQIAADCGFSDARGLILHFKREYHVTPHQYRKQKRHTDSITEKV